MRQSAPCGTGWRRRSGRAVAVGCSRRRSWTPPGRSWPSGKTNEITRFRPLLDRISDLPDTVITADALHCQREHVTYLAERGAHWILTVKGNQPSLHAQLAALPWRHVPVAHQAREKGHGRAERRTMKTTAVAAGLAFPHAAQAIQIVRRRRPLTCTKWSTETVYAITSLTVIQARPADLARFICGHWGIDDRLH